MELKVGNVVVLAIPMLGCDTGTRGVVYDTYKDFDEPKKHGASIIFENGAFDGFSYEDQGVFLNEEKVVRIPFFVREYKFENVMKLTKDFENGHWNDIFN